VRAQGLARAWLNNWVQLSASIQIKKTENLLDDQESLTPNKGSDEECTRACNKLLNRYVYRQGIYTFITPENEAI